MWALQHRLKHFDIPTALTDWAIFAQDRGALYLLVTKPALPISWPFRRALWGDTRASMEENRSFQSK
jgi:hypothetical protein